MTRVWNDEWELERMGIQLHNDPKGHETAIKELRYWNQAIDPITRKPYWWHDLTRQIQWDPPLLDGKDPYQWHPDLKQVQMH